MYIKLKSWAAENFDNKSMPTIVTLQKLCREGQIEGATKIGEKWYVKVNPETRNKGLKHEQR